jgi:hypothetical protein
MIAPATSVQSKRVTRSGHVNATGIAVPVTANENSESAMLNGTRIDPLRFPRKLELVPAAA